MRVDFSSRNPYSDGAEWKWRLKDKDDHVIEGARERFGKVGKVIGEDFGNIKGNVGIEMNKIKAYCRSFSGGSFKGNAIKILKDSGSTIKTMSKNYFRNDDGVLKHIKSVLKPNISAVFAFSDTVKKVPYMRGQNNNFVKNLGKISYVGTQINNGVNAATQVLNIATGNVRDNWDTTSKWNKMIKGIDNVSDRENKTLDTYTIQTSTRYNNLNYIFN